MWYVGVFCRGGRWDWTDVSELGGEWAGEGGEGWADKLVCVEGFLVLLLVLDWTQCLPQGAGAPPAILRDCMTGFPPKKMWAWASGEAG